MMLGEFLRFDSSLDVAPCHVTSRAFALLTSSRFPSNSLINRLPFFLMVSFSRETQKSGSAARPVVSGLSPARPCKPSAKQN